MQNKRKRERDILHTVQSTAAQGLPLKGGIAFLSAISTLFNLGKFMEGNQQRKNCGCHLSVTMEIAVITFKRTQMRYPSAQPPPFSTGTAPSSHQRLLAHITRVPPLWCRHHSVADMIYKKNVSALYLLEQTKTELSCEIICVSIWEIEKKLGWP